MSERFFITGGSGFIGGELVKLIRAGGNSVVNYDIAPPHFRDDCDRWIQGDVRDASALERAAVEFQPDYLLHLASDTDVSVRELSHFTTTLDGTRNVLAVARKLRSLKRLIHVSTQFVLRPGLEPLDEHHLEPYTIYGVAKAETERLVWAAQLEVPWLILRPTIIWGPHHPTFARAIFKHLANRTYLHPTGREPIIRAFGYVRNAAYQMLGLAKLPEGNANSRVFYLGDEEIDYDTWADAFALGLTGRAARRIPINLLKLLGRVGDVLRAIGVPAPIDSGRAFRMTTSSRIDLTPTHAIVGRGVVPFDLGVEETVAWFRQTNAKASTDNC